MTTSPKPLNPQTLRDLLRTYFGRLYIMRLAPILGISPHTISGWIHLNNPVRPLYLRKLAAYTPRAHKRIDEWRDKRIARMHEWAARKHIELDEAQKTLLWAAESAERNSRKPKENSSL